MSEHPLLRRVPAVWSLAAGTAPGLLVAHVAVALITGALPVAIAWLTKLLLDALSTGGPVLGPVLGLALAGLAAGVAPHVTRYLKAELDRRVELVAQDRLFGAVERFTGLRRFEDPEFLDRLRLARQAGSNTADQAVDGVLGIGAALLTVGGFAGSLSLISPWLAVLVLSAGVPTLIAEIALSRRRARMLWEIGPAERREIFYSDLLSTVEAAKEVRLFGIGPFLRGRMRGEREQTNAAKRAVDRREALTQTGLGLLAALVAGSGLGWAASAAARGEFSVGDVTVFAAAVAGVQLAVAGLANELARTHHALLLFGHYQEVLTAAPDLPPATRPRRIGPLREGIELRDVWFRYSDEHPWVLRGVSLYLPHGTNLALVGLNGAGKSTLVSLLCRFYDPCAGSIRWDGTDLREFDIAELRHRIGAVFQDYMEYDLTVAENIGLGDLTALDDPARVRAAAERAGVHQRVTELPDGYRTLLSRTFFAESEKDDPVSGVLLSGGQWQRLALARAFLRDRRDLMILDEPAAGLDAVAEHEIHHALRHHRRGRTSVLISHRLGALRSADRIAVLHEGRVVEEGTHAELLAAGGQYATLYRLQAAGYQEPATLGGN
ncbi:ABC transporter ATP-binding protein [Amycolatopsis lurida]